MTAKSPKFYVVTPRSADGVLHGQSLYEEFRKAFDKDIVKKVVYTEDDNISMEVRGQRDEKPEMYCNAELVK